MITKESNRDGLVGCHGPKELLALDFSPIERDIDHTSDNGRSKRLLTSVVSKPLN